MRGPEIPNRGYPSRKYSVGEISLCEVLCDDLEIRIGLLLPSGSWPIPGLFLGPLVVLDIPT